MDFVCFDADLEANIKLQLIIIGDYLKLASCYQLDAYYEARSVKSEQSNNNNDESNKCKNVLMFVKTTTT